MPDETLQIISSRDDTASKPQEISPKSTANLPTILAFTLLLGVLVITGFLYFRSMTLESERTTIMREMAEKQKSIDMLKVDPKVRAAEIFSLNKGTIEKTITASNAANFVRELERIHADENNLTFNGFNYSAGKITSSVTSFKGIDDDAVRKVIRLIRGYRDGSTNSSSGSLARFELSPITSVSGKNDKRSISVEFNVQ